jgi:hypothetical protein
MYKLICCLNGSAGCGFPSHRWLGVSYLATPKNVAGRMLPLDAFHYLGRCLKSKITVL